jgi:hypothetical protein
MVKSDARTKSLAGAMCGVTVSGFEVAVTSIGQHDVPPPRSGFGPFGFGGVLLPER